jgi:hypothetical protein
MNIDHDGEKWTKTKLPRKQYRIYDTYAIASW